MEFENESKEQLNEQQSSSRDGYQKDYRPAGRAPRPRIGHNTRQQNYERPAYNRYQSDDDTAFRPEGFGAGLQQSQQRQYRARTFNSNSPYHANSSYQPRQGYQPRQEGYQPRQEGYQPRQEGYRPRYNQEQQGGDGTYMPRQQYQPRQQQGGYQQRQQQGTGYQRQGGFQPRQQRPYNGGGYQQQAGGYQQGGQRKPFQKKQRPRNYEETH